MLYLVNRCPKLTSILFLILTEENIYKLPRLPLIDTCIGIVAQLSLEQLQAKLPNLRMVQLNNHLSQEYVTEFCRAYPLLISLYMPVYEEGFISDDLAHTISSLQHLRELLCGNFTNDQVSSMVRKLPNLEKLFLKNCQQPFSLQTVVSLSQMPKLKHLRIPVEVVMKNMHVFISADDNFSRLTKLRLCGDKAQSFAAGFKFANSRSGLEIEIEI